MVRRAEAIPPDTSIALGDACDPYHALLKGIFSDGR